MPTPCSIPGCRTNRSKNDPIATVFNFPKDSVRREQWEWAVQQLHAPSYNYREGSKICIRHFEEEFIEREHRAVRDDGSIFTLPRKAATLSNSAVPTKFEFLPDPIRHRKDFSYMLEPGSWSRRVRLAFKNLNDLKNELEMRLAGEFAGWNVVSNETLPALSLYKINITEDLEPEIKFSVTFNEHLSVKIVHPTLTLAEVLKAIGQRAICDDWNKLNRLIRLLNGEQPPQKKKCRMKVFEKGDVVVLEISPEEVKIEPVQIDDCSVKYVCDETGRDESDSS